MTRGARNLKNILTGLCVFLLLLAVVFLVKGFLEGRFESAETLRAYMETFGAAAPLALTVFQMLQVVLPVLPGFVGCITGAGMFGPFLGFWCSYIGISAGSVIAFLLARRFGVGLVRQLISLEKYESFAAWVRRRKSFTLVLFLSILLPLAPDDFLCYFSGLTGMPARRFIWIIVLGKPWCILFYSLATGYFLF